MTHIPENIKVTEAKPFRNHWLLVTFSDGEKRLFSADLLHGSAFAPLADEALFLHPVLFRGVMTWKNGEIDVAPEYVYDVGLPYQENKKDEERSANG